jgi:superkiller protein 3
MTKLCSGVAAAGAALLTLALACPAEAADGPTQRKVDAYLQLAREFKADRNWTAAEANYRKALEFDPVNVPALNELAWVYNETRQYEQAVDAALMSLLVDDNGEAWRELGYALLRQGEYQRAEDALTFAIDKRPTDAAAYNYRAAARDGLGKIVEADQDREKARQLKAGKDKPLPNNIF